MTRFGTPRPSWLALSAALWCVIFACLHIYWAVGGSAGLASSAGQDLADHRPMAFVIFGLYGVALALLIGAVIVLAAGAAPRYRRIATVLIAIAGAGLLLRAVALEALLAANLGGIQAQIGQLETRGSQLLWNPWFAIGGALFILTAFTARRRTRLTGI